MTDENNNNWIDDLIAAAAERAKTETPEQKQARHMRLHRRLSDHEGVPPLEVVKAEDDPQGDETK